MDVDRVLSECGATRRSGQEEDADEGISGDSDFVNAILKEAEDRAVRQLRLQHSGATITTIIEEACVKEQRSLRARDMCSAV